MKNYVNFQELPERVQLYLIDMYEMADPECNCTHPSEMIFSIKIINELYEEVYQILTLDELQMKNRVLLYSYEDHKDELPF